MAQHDDEEAYRARPEAKLTPGRIRATLAFLGLSQLTHEMIKDAVLDEVRGFFVTGFGNRAEQDEERYATAVLSKAPNSRFRASLLWLVRRARSRSSKQIGSTRSTHIGTS